MEAPSDRIARAIEDALSAVASNAQASVITRAALRVAILRRDVVAEFWLRMEVQGINDASRPRNRELLARLTAQIGEDDATRQWESAGKALTARRTTTVDGTKIMLAPFVAELESLLASMEAIHDDEIPAGMTPLDTGMAFLERQKARSTLSMPLAERRGVLERVKDAAYTYVLDAEAQILAGETVPDSVARGREFVARSLQR
ncbi:hypothetical protein [Curtobacterium sp. VKM Ac-2887]|uniref:hypothetical protein n=1 Tax=Curtobacterium sp. VKM Ac-2887 TaxID=2783819 RepID=UPI00188C0871|nr:hypothetical protein [Curtobacterium sp. VKM Ac-2887]MBF4587404.1 hypothetical protein [Curtobacterium sp. VKM Ac-2887]